MVCDRRCVYAFLVHGIAEPIEAHLVHGRALGETGRKYRDPAKSAWEPRTTRSSAAVFAQVSLVVLVSIRQCIRTRCSSSILTRCRGGFLTTSKAYYEHCKGLLACLSACGTGLLQLYRRGAENCTRQSNACSSPVDARGHQYVRLLREMCGVWLSTAGCCARRLLPASTVPCNQQATAP